MRAKLPSVSLRAIAEQGAGSLTFSVEGKSRVDDMPHASPPQELKEPGGPVGLRLLSELPARLSTDLFCGRRAAAAPRREGVVPGRRFPRRLLSRRGRTP